MQHLKVLSHVARFPFKSVCCKFVYLKLKGYGSSSTPCRLVPPSSLSPRRSPCFVASIHGDLGDPATAGSTGATPERRQTTEKIRPQLTTTTMTALICLPMLALGKYCVAEHRWGERYRGKDPIGALWLLLCWLHPAQWPRALWCDPRHHCGGPKKDIGSGKVGMS